MAPSLDLDVLARLAVLHGKLEAEGMYVRANTVWIAMEEIRFLRTPTQEPELPKQLSNSGKELSSHDIAVDALESLLHQLALTPPDYETHPELCAAIDAAKEDLLTIKTRVFAGMGKQLSETGKEVSEAAA